MSSERYLLGHQPSVVRVHAWRTAENSAAYLLPWLRSGQRVLDVGAGPGTITADLAELVAPGAVLGLDAADEVLVQARATARARGLMNVEFAIGDAYALELEDASIDVVHAHQLLQHLGRPVDALREFRRVLAPGGLVAVRDVDYAGAIWYPELPGLEEWMDLYVRLARASGGEPAAGRRLLAWGREAGFAELTPSAGLWLFATPEDRDWWGGNWAERAVASDFAAAALEHGFADRAGLERIAQGWRDWAAAPDGWFLMPHGELLARG